MGATTIASLEAKLGADTSGLDAGLRKAQRQMQQFATGMQSAGRAMTIGVSLPAAAAGAGLLKMASDAVESENLFQVSMGNMADSARAWSEDLRKQLGVNSYETRRMLGTFQAMFTGMQIGEEASLDMAKGLTQLSYDLASFYNLSRDDALTKLQAAISGEVEPLRRLGVVVDEATVKAYAVAQGWAKAGDELSAQQKTLARYGVIMAQTAKAQGDLARTADSPANRMRRIGEEAHQAATELGMVFLPMASEALGWVTNRGIPAAQTAVQNFTQEWSVMSEESRRNILITAGLFVTSGPLLTGIGAGIKGVGLLGSAFGKLPKIAKLAVLDVVGILAPMAAAMEASSRMSLEAFNASRAYQGLEPVNEDDFTTRMAQYKRELDGYKQTLSDAVGGTADIMADALFGAIDAQLQGLGKGLNDLLNDPLADARNNAAMLAQASLAAANSTADLAAEAGKHPPIIQRSRKEVDALRDSLNAAGLSMSQFTDHLVAQHPAAMAAAEAVSTLEMRITGLQDQQEAWNESIRQAQDYLGGLTERASELRSELSEAQAKLAELSTPRLKGMGEAENQQAWAERQKQRIEYARKTGMSMEEVMKLFPAMSEAEAEFIKTLPTSISGIDRFLDLLNLTSDLKFDEAIRLIKQEAEGVEEELTFDEAIKSIQDTKIEIDNLNGAIADQEAAIRGQQQAIADMQTAASDMAGTIKDLQKDLAEQKLKQDLVNDALKTAYDWFLLDKKAIGELGPAGVAAAELVDDSMREMLGLVDTFVDEWTSSALGSLQSVIDKANEAKAALAGVGAPGAPTGGHTESHAIGGIVSGPIGMPRLIVAHGGEQVLTPSERSRATAEGGDTNITVNMPNVRQLDRHNIEALTYQVARVLQEKRR